MIAYISIGNSDDKLTQVRWSRFVAAVNNLLWGVEVHGRWFSAPDVQWQNACWCIEFDPDQIHDNSPHYYDCDTGSWQTHTAQTRTLSAHLRRQLSCLAHKYEQDSIAWAQVDTTELIRPPGHQDG